MDQGVIDTFNACYLPITFIYLVKSTDNQMIVKEFWKAIRDVLCDVEESWKEITRSSMNGVWGKVPLNVFTTSRVST